jgi:hypothetical protein
MKLLVRCTTIQSDILKRNDLRRAHKDAEAFRERAGELRTIRDVLADALERVVVLKTKGLSVTKAPTPTTAIAVLGECQDTLSETPTESGKDYGRLKRSVDKLGRDLLSIADKAIESVRRDLPAVDEAFLKQVELIPGYAVRVATVRQQRDALLRGSDPRESAQALRQFLDRREALGKLADDLNPTEFPKEILEFFKAGRNGGAPLDKLTSTVREWLSERNLLKDVRVTVISR